jgi:hypothetical protein
VARPEKAETALKTLKRKMPPGVFGELVAAAPQLPTWLAQSVGRLHELERNDKMMPKQIELRTGGCNG